MGDKSCEGVEAQCDLLAVLFMASGIVPWLERAWRMVLMSTGAMIGQFVLSGLNRRTQMQYTDNKIKSIIYSEE